MAFVGYVAAALLVVGLVHLLQRWLKWVQGRKRIYELMAKIPGPKALPLLGTTYQFKLDRVDFSYQLEEFAKKYAKNGAMKLWIGTTPMVALTSAKTAEPILTSNKLIEKSNNYDIFLPWLGTGLLISKPPKWNARRKMLTPTFHFNILNSFLPVFNNEAKTLIECLEKEAKPNNVFDMYLYLKRCTLDVICETAMGTSVNAQRNIDSDYVNAVCDMNEVTFTHERQPWLWLKPIWYALGYGHRYDKNLKLLTEFTRDVIHKREKALRAEAADLNCTLAELPEKRYADDDIASTKKRMAFLDLLLCMSEANKLTKEDIREEVDTFMFEGHDTTGSGMSFTVYFIGTLPHIQEKIHEELDAVLGPPPTSRDITVEDLNQLKYLERCIKEGLRVTPPVPLFARPVTEEIKCGDYTLPAGCTAAIIPLMIHRQEEDWGEDADFGFDPDRFLPENMAKRHPFAYVPFSAGPRNCIGQKFALMEEKVVLAHLFHNYRVESTVDVSFVLGNMQIQ